MVVSSMLCVCVTVYVVVLLYIKNLMDENEETERSGASFFLLLYRIFPVVKCDLCIAEIYILSAPVFQQ